MAIFKVNKLCSKEKLWRIFVALLILLAGIFLIFLGPFFRIISLFIGLYLLITGLVGSCLIYAIFKS